MADEDKNRFESHPTWINWKGLDNGSVLRYCQKDYHKPRDEEDLKNKMMKGNKRDSRLPSQKDLE